MMVKRSQQGVSRPQCPLSPVADMPLREAMSGKCQLQTFCFNHDGVTQKPRSREL
jgi:hypothetical protein